ncbi:oligosaccharide flippase family protein [Aegicerativicinus sediminis]|uniref:oligosaccharide flippase family protein n=1 Tax=Aegicerativicinus sediminis TaxID=2893202 RepID=UPI001E390703|nr:oligosaccharide flippase family protein [Aegicerativicinus sediminis]
MTGRGYNKQIINNSLLSVLQITISALVILVIYKFVINSVGIEEFGLWSLIISVTSFSELGNFGFSGSLIKYSAELSTRNSFKELIGLLNVSFIFLALLTGVLLLAVYTIGDLILPFLVESNLVELGKNVMLFILLGLYLNVLAGLFFAVLEGLNISYLKSISIIIASITYLVSTIYMVNSFGLIGLAYAYVIQASVYFILGIYCICKRIKNYHFFKLKIPKGLWRRFVSYSVKFMFIGLSQTLYDPVTKVILSRFGGLSFVALFEVATKLIIQVRGLVLGILKNILPKIVALKSLNGNGTLEKQFSYVFKLNLVLLIITLGLILPNLKIISIMFIGTFDVNFVLVGLILILGWFINSITISAYIFNLGTAHLSWNLISHIAIGILNLVFCLITGLVFSSGVGIILSWSLSLSLGSLLLLIEYHKRNHLDIKTYFNPLSFNLLAHYSIFTLFSVIINYYINQFYILIVVQTILAIVFLFSLYRINFVKHSVLHFKDLLLSNR